MQEFDEWLQLAEAQRRGTSGHDDHGVRALFYNRPMLDEKATAIEGHPVYNTVPFVEIRIPGDPRSVVHVKVTDEERRRFPKAWAAFLAGQAGAADGTPIDLLPSLTVSQVATLKHCSVQTIEQLAAVPDDALPRIGPNGRAMRERAQQFFKGASEVEKDLRAKLEAQAAEISDLKAKLNQLLMAPAAPAAAADEPAKPARRAA